MLVQYARGSQKYLAGIDSLARRAHYVAGRAGRETPTLGDVAEALSGSVVPSDNALAQTLAGTTAKGRASGLQGAARAMRKAVTTHLQTPRPAAALSPAPSRDAGAAVMTFAG